MMRPALPLLYTVLASLGVPSCSDAPVETPASTTTSLTAAAPLRVGRAMHTTTTLPDGRILVVGGGPADARAELFDAALRTSVAIPMTLARMGHTATLLHDGTVLVLGGGYGSDPALRSAELFDPATQRFRPTGGPTEPRTDHAAVLLPSGKVLVLGGDPSGVGATPTASAEIYDPATGTFTPTSGMLTPRRVYGATLLPTGSVLVAGGTTTNKRVVADAELYDIASGRFTRTAPLAHAREKHTAALLADGTVLVMGGSNERNGAGRLEESEVYDPRARTFTAGPRMHAARHKIASLALADGSVLVAGGASDLAELYDPTSRSFTQIPGSAGVERFFPALTMLGDGRVLISGGYTTGGAKTDTWTYRR